MNRDLDLAEFELHPRRGAVLAECMLARSPGHMPALRERPMDISFALPAA